MTGRRFFLFFFWFLVLGATLVAQTKRIPEASIDKQQVFESYGKLPLSFEANQGQTDAKVKFLSHGSGYTLFLTPSEVVLSLSNPEERPEELHKTGAAPTTGADEETRAPEPVVLRMQLVGASPEPAVTGFDELPGTSNYFTGSDPKKWRTNVPNYARVKYREVYPGIDLVYYGNQRQLEYDFVVAPGADPKAIRLAFEGADEISLDDKGNLILHTNGGEVVQRAPVIYQESEGVKEAIPGGYVLQNEHEVGFQVAVYDASKTLVIDPVLVYSTYLGGSGQDGGFKLAVDATGNAYVTGITASTNFPTMNPIQAAYGGGPFDCYVAKLNPAGTALVYSTYLGGSSFDDCAGIAVDSSGHAHVVGGSWSANFPTVNAFQPVLAGGPNDVFVAKLNATGDALLYSTFLGGSAADHAGAIALDASGNVYVTGVAASTNFPTTLGAFQITGGGFRGDAIVAKIDPSKSGSASLVYSTYLGGNAGHGGEGGNGIAVEPNCQANCNAYVTGQTASTNFPTTPGAFDTTCGTGTVGDCNGFNLRDGFVTKLDPTGSALVYSAYFGGSNHDRGLSIAVDASGNAYITGETCSTDFPTVNPFQATHGGGPCTGTSDGDAFVMKVNGAGSALVYSTYLGGSASESASRITVDASGNAYVVGLTPSADFPTVNALQPNYGGGLHDAFVTKLNTAGNELLFSTYLGGSGDDGSGGVALSSSGNIYVSGSTNSTDFPTTPGAFDISHNGDYDVFVVKIADVPPDTVGPVTSNVVATPNPVAVNNGITLTATIDDTNTGGSDIASADYEILDGTTVSLSGTGDNGVCFDPLLPCPVPDLEFNAVMENVEVTIPAGSLAPGVYDACVRGTDSNENLGAFTCSFLVVYDPDGGFVTGGGWIMSPAGASTEFPDAVGKANFGFVSKYKRGATVPTGNTQFKFKAGDLNFHSTEYEWLVIAGPLAQYKGSGKINGSGDYGFLLTANDSAVIGGPASDTFRIKIWDKGNGGGVVYDNVTDQAIGGGSIVIHSN